MVDCRVMGCRGTVNRVGFGFVSCFDDQVIEKFYTSPSWWRVTLLNSSNGSEISPLGVASPESIGTPFIFEGAGVPPMSTLPLSLTLRKLTVSTPRPWCGIMGGFIWRISAHCVWRKNGWVLTSEAPARAPRRFVSSLINSLRINDLHRLHVVR